MKNGILIGTLFLLSFSTWGAGGDKSSGCGLGWKIAPRMSLLSSSTRSYTNMLASNSSAMTSGTSGCAKHSIVKNEYKGIHYVTANYHQLITDMANGEGEVLDGLAEVVNYTGDKLFFRLLIQQNYGAIYPNKDTTPEQIYHNFQRVVVETQTFAFL